MSINRSWAAFGVQLLEIYCTKDCEQELEEEGLGICIFKTPAVSPSQSESTSTALSATGLGLCLETNTSSNKIPGHSHFSICIDYYCYTYPLLVTV